VGRTSKICTHDEYKQITKHKVTLECSETHSHNVYISVQHILVE